MSSESVPIQVDRVSKSFPVYERPADRLRQFVIPRLQGLFNWRRGRYYDEYWALRNISFEVRKGEQLGIVGRNGAGKSTLLQIICGTLEPTLGDVRISGRVAALLELGAGFNPELTGTENVFLNGSVLGLSRADIETRFDRIVGFADIPGFLDQPVKNYSSGMFMRLAFAVAVHVEPDILVVDEALSVGDEAYQRKCHARIRKLRDDGATILFVSHSAGHVTEVCDRALLLDGGEMLCFGQAKTVVSQYQKLLYASAEKRDEVRRDIAGLGVELGLDQAAAVTLDAPRRRVAQDKAYWDEGLVPDSTVVYPLQGCRISDPHIETLDGERVNVLRAGDTYRYCYEAEFTEPAVAVRFGMMIRNVTGVEIGGSASHPEADPVAFVASGSRASVAFQFTNLLAPGTYFLNAGIVGLEGEEEKYLSRWIDVATFRVMSDPDRLATGFVDLCVVPRISLT